MTAAGFEPVTPVRERLQTQALDSAATGIGVTGSADWKFMKFGTGWVLLKFVVSFVMSFHRSSHVLMCALRGATS